jgi:hypothetical protein
MPASNDVHALSWRSPEQLGRLRAGLQEELEAWSRDWGLTALTLQVDNAWQACAPTQTVWRPAALAPDGSTVAWIGQAEDAAPALESLLFGSAASAPSTAAEESTLSIGLAGDALAALKTRLARWLAATQAGSAPAIQSPPASDARAWSGAVLACAGFGAGGSQLSLWLHVRSKAWPRAVASNVGAQRSTAPSLHALPDAMADRSLQLRARLTDVQATLGELMDLREGDVLVTAHRLADPLLVTPADREEPAVFGGRLVQRQGRMALALVQAS